MRWTNRGHQLDDIGKKYAAIKKLYVLGSVKQEKDIRDLLKWLGLENDLEVVFLINDFMTVRQRLGLIRRFVRGTSEMNFASVAKLASGFHKTNLCLGNSSVLPLSELGKYLPQNHDEAVIVLLKLIAKIKRIHPAEGEYVRCCCSFSENEGVK